MTVRAVRPLAVADSVLDLIGGTPMVRLGRFAGEGEAEILAKCDFLIPCGSVKDRLGPGRRVVTILPDGAELYMSQGIL